jgi:hypothetical protein
MLDSARGITLGKKVAKCEIELGLPAMVPDIVHRFQMIRQRET